MASTAREILVGRDQELQRVRAVIDGAGDTGAALVVSGGAGIGKSALLAEAEHRAREHGFRVFSTTGIPSEARLPFAALDHLLRPVADAAHRLPAPQRRALDAALGRSDQTAPDVHLIALAVLSLLYEAAIDKPVVVLVEDGHWIDRPTCEVLAFVARRLERDAVVLLVAIRDGVPSALDGTGVPVLEVGPLGDAPAEELLDRAAPGLPVEVRRRLLREAAGNPLALIELPKAFDAHGTQALTDDPLPLTTRLEQIFAGRLTDAAEDTRTVLLLAALEESAQLAELLYAAELLLGRPVAVAALEPTVAAGLGAVDADRFRFRHPLVRSALQQAATDAQRRRAHAALACALAAQPDRSIWHRAAATVGPDESVATELDAAAARAADRGALTVTVAALQTAASLSEDVRRKVGRLLRAAELAFELGRSDVSLPILDECKRLDLLPYERTAVAYILELECGSWSGAEAIRRVARTAADLNLAGQPAQALEALGRVALRCHWANLDNATRHVVVQTAELVTASRDDPTFLSILALTDPVNSAGEVIHRAMELQPDGYPPKQNLALGWAASAVWADEVALPFLVEASDSFRRLGQLSLLCQTLVCLAWSHLRTGHLRAVFMEAAEALTLAIDTGQPRQTASAQTALAIAEAERGHDADADELAAAAEALLLPMGAGPILSMVQVARGRAALAGERFSEAYEHLARVFDIHEIAYHPFVGAWVLADLAEAAVYGEGGLHLVEEQLAAWASSAGDVPAGNLRAQLAYVRALLAPHSEAEHLFRLALGTTAELPYYRARTQLAFGGWLRRRRRAGESRTCLRDAARIFDALGHPRRADRARRELRASGETTRTREPTAWDQLTAQELHIAYLAAEGLTNREIAERLYLSHRTVGSHLYKLFPKVGVTSRSQLRAALRLVGARDPDPDEVAT